MQQHFIAQNYPGLLDAVTPGVSYSDLVSILPDVTDCGLLNHYFDNAPDPSEWPASRRSKVDGYPPNADGTNTTCRTWDGFAHTWVSPFNGFDPVVPVELRYHPITNPTGARGSFTDGMVNVFGIDPATGFARTVYDNVGVQYGLKALNNGDITTTEFLDLNQFIGGLDVDGNYTPARSQGNLEGIEVAYRKGVVDSGQPNSADARHPNLYRRHHRHSHPDSDLREARPAEERKQDQRKRSQLAGCARWIESAKPLGHGAAWQ